MKTQALWIALIAVNPFLVLAAEPVGSSKSPAPAQVSRSVRESDLNRVTLSPEAERRLGIVIQTVERKAVRRMRDWSGEACAAPGDPSLGGGTLARQSVLPLLPALGPGEVLRLAQSQLEADGQVEQARVTHELAKVVLARAEQLMRDGAGSVRAVDEARALEATTGAAWVTARERRELFGPRVLDRQVPRELWVRVAVPAGDLLELDVKAPVAVTHVNPGVGVTGWSAIPVEAPPSANAASGTVDLFYGMPNPESSVRPGQRLRVTIPLKGSDEAWVVPRTSVLYDIHGGTWVYEGLGSQAYVRRRVQVVRMTETEAVLATGLGAGVKVVKEGAVELFGTEFGVGK